MARLPVSLLLSVILSVCAPGTRADTVSVAVAANFAPTMHALARVFEHSGEHALQIATGASGKFVAQVRHGAPFQVFLSADDSKPIELVRLGLAVPDSRFTYAIGELALWSSVPGFVDGTPARLTSGAFDRLALANPRLAPYGAAAVATLEHLNLANATRAKWVQGENVAQTYQFVHSGNAQLGFVAMAQLIARGETQNAWRVPAHLHPAIRQDAVLLARGADSRGAQALLTFLRTPEARRLIEAHGYRTERPAD